MLAETVPGAGPVAGAGAPSPRSLLRAGRVTEALRALEEDTEPSGEALAMRVECLLARGELDAALLLRERLAGAGGPLAASARAELATASGDHDAAAQAYAAAGALAASTAVEGDDPDLVPWRAGAALALVRLGRAAEARALAAEHLALARRRGSAHAVAQALRIAAATSLGGDRGALLREARAVLGSTVAERLAAQVDTDLAVLLVLEGDLPEAVRLLRSAEEYAGREDLHPLRSRVRALLQRLGQAPRLVWRETLTTLTPQEQRAAALAASGLTNRDIARELEVTVKAVEWHLSHVYRKLGITRRTMLADALGRA